MRTLEEVKKHIHEVGYTDTAQLRIAGFLVGVGVKDEHEIIVFRNGVNEFSTFLHWFNNSSTELKVKAYQDGKWFDITFDEICGNLKKYNPVICDGVMPDDILEKIWEELSGKEEPKYKYVGEEREELKKDKKTLIDIIESNEKYLKYEAVYNAPYDFIIKLSNAQCKAKLDDIERKLHETVD